VTYLLLAGLENITVVHEERLKLGDDADGDEQEVETSQ
jgi:hypothetical protein